MKVRVFTSVSVKVGGERSWLFARSAIFEVCHFRGVQTLTTNVAEKKAAGSIDAFVVAFNRPVFRFWRACVLMATLCSSLLLRLHESVLPKMLLGAGRSPLFAQQPSRRSWLSRGWLTCVDGGIDEHGGSRALPCVRASDQVCRAGFQRAVYVCRWWDRQAWRISLTCYFLSGRCQFATHATLRHRFHAVTAHHCAVLLNKDTFERDVTTNSIMIPAKKKVPNSLLRA